PQTFQAEVALSIRPDVHLPQDSEAIIDSEGLLGGKFVKLIPGRSTVALEEGGTLEHTRSYRSLEEMVGDIIFLATDSGSGGGSK
ncbi:MAG: outer membrane lipid asymmetry maintenance protein MlaD, partial [Rhodospirillaceae bacterium]|nr:outer membrane lipid asymmetry maintenance protein MlaD [Rhodospirillaceae bacterium]